MSAGIAVNSLLAMFQEGSVLLPVAPLEGEDDVIQGSPWRPWRPRGGHIRLNTGMLSGAHCSPMRVAPRCGPEGRGALLPGPNTLSRGRRDDGQLTSSCPERCQSLRASVHRLELAMWLLWCPRPASGWCRQPHSWRAG